MLLRSSRNVFQSHFRRSVALPSLYARALSSKNSAIMDYSKLATPPVCVADFCLIPIGTPTASVSTEVAAVQRLMKASGLDYSMHSAGTTVEGPWDEVMRVIGQAHTLVHTNGSPRVQTDIRVGSRTDKSQHFSEKVAKVNAILASDSPAPAAPTPTSSSAAPAPAEAAPAPAPAGAEAQSTGKQTWASMFKK